MFFKSNFLLLHLLTSCSQANVVTVNRGDVLTFYGKVKESFAKYALWKVAGYGLLKFQFRTSHANGLLLYVDDNLHSNKGNYLKLEIIRNRVELEIQVRSGSKRSSTLKKERRELGNKINDNNYHFVELEILQREILFMLDGRDAKIDLADKSFEIFSYVYIGGIYPTDNPMLFVHPRIQYLKGFVGCMSNLRYTSTRSQSNMERAQLVRTNFTTEGCQNMCFIRRTEECQHRGRCMNRYYETGCDCHGTGYSGPTCRQESPSLHLDGHNDTIIAWIPQEALNSYATDIFIRFKTAQRSNIIFSAQDRHTNGYLFIELHASSIYFHFKTEDIKEQIIKLGDVARNRTAWRYVKIEKRNRNIAVKLNDGKTGREYVRQLEDDNDAKLSGYLNISKVFIGGIGHKELLKRLSRNRRNFKGCIQDVIINKYNIIKLALDKDKSIHQPSGIKDECPRHMISEGDKKFPSDTISLETSDSKGKTVMIRPKPTGKFEEERRKKESEESITWIILIACGTLFILLIITTLIVRHYYRKKIRKEQKLCENYLNQQVAARRGNEEIIGLHQKCIRNEIDTKCDLHTFSPVRRDFYVSEFDTILRTQDAAQSPSSRHQKDEGSSTESVPYVHDTIVSYDSVNRRVESLFRDKNANRCRKVSCGSNNSSAYGRNNNKTEVRYAQPCQQQGTHFRKIP